MCDIEGVKVGNARICQIRKITGHAKSRIITRNTCQNVQKMFENFNFFFDFSAKIMSPFKDNESLPKYKFPKKSSKIMSPFKDTGFKDNESRL